MERKIRRANGRRARMRELQRAAGRVSFLIVASDYPLIDITIERANLRELALALFPEEEELYQMVYEARFDRLIEQFRESETVL